MRHAKIIFKDSKYNYQTRINGTKPEIIRYFAGPLNMGGMRYDHVKDKEIEVDDMQTPIKIEVFDTCNICEKVIELSAYAYLNEYFTCQLCLERARIKEGAN